jgi:hypothetical protein
VDAVGLFPFQVLFCCGNGSRNVSSKAIVPEVIYEVLDYPVQEVGYPYNKQVVGCLHVLERRSVGFQVSKSSRKSFASNSLIVDRH